MKLNSEIQIIGRSIIFVPYRISHVDKYHKWMESYELREQTASERLTLEEEYAMQKTWLNDEEKCTFIVLDKKLMDSTKDEIVSMIGDANLYLRKEDDVLIGEVGLMIAEQGHRGRGRGKETALTILRYGIEAIGINKFVAVISEHNEGSIQLFMKLKFIKEHESKVFHEITMSRCVDEEFIASLRKEIPEYTIITQTQE